MTAALRRRRGVALVASAVVPLALVVVFGHRGVHAVRDLLVPGAGQYGHRTVVGIVITALAVAATMVWVRIGADWVLGGVIAAAVLASLVLSPGSDRVVAAALHVDRATHEFPLVVLVAGVIGWARTALSRVGLTGRPGRSGRGVRPSVVDRTRAAAIDALAGDRSPAAGLVDDVAVARRAARIGLIARARRGGDPFRRDHAGARAALALGGALDAEATARFCADARVGLLGVPCSEPGWVRLLDATLAALALREGGDRVGARWHDDLATWFRLRRGHRAACVWTPLGVPLGHAVAWDQAAATSLAAAAGWCDDADWQALRRRALGAAARGARRTDDARLVAAARVWTSIVDDPAAARILDRPTLAADPVAAALDHLATRLRHQPDLLRAVQVGPARSLRPDIRAPQGATDPAGPLVQEHCR